MWIVHGGIGLKSCWEEAAFSLERGICLWVLQDTPCSTQASSSWVSSALLGFLRVAQPAEAVSCHSWEWMEWKFPLVHQNLTYKLGLGPAWSSALEKAIDLTWTANPNQTSSKGRIQASFPTPQGLLSPWTPGAAAPGFLTGIPMSQALNEVMTSLEFVWPPYVLSLSGFTGPSSAHLPSLPDESLLRGKFYRSLFIAAGWGVFNNFSTWVLNNIWG